MLADRHPAKHVFVLFSVTARPFVIGKGVFLPALVTRLEPDHIGVRHQFSLIQAKEAALLLRSNADGGLLVSRIWTKAAGLPVFGQTSECRFLSVSHGCLRAD